MRQSIVTSAGVTLLVTVMTMSLAGGADAATGLDYSQHVRACSASVGFSATHNPGIMHHGFSDWDPTHVC